MSVLDRIVRQRRRRIEQQGHALGASLPAARSLPLVPFGADPFLVCEVKRRSPSRGDIAPDLDARGQARLYAARGVRSISVLTEEDNFGGSLDDLAAIKAALPHVAILRKDFLLDEEDVDVSWRAGADAVLLIASVLDADMLAAMYRRARGLGMQALVEVHDEKDVEKCRAFAPELTGINSRDLATFTVDLLLPVRLRPRIDWRTRLVFESGVRGPEDVMLALSAGFDGVLVGETAVKSPDSVAGLLSAFGHRPGDFWARLCARMRPGRPLVKICGITRAADAELAAGLGADALGFVFAQSRRRAEPVLLRDLAGLDVLKVAVVVTGEAAGPNGLDPAVKELLDDGLLHAVQFHGAEQPDECASLAFPYYKAVRVRGPADIEAMAGFRSPRVLADAWSAHAAGGTGQRIPRDLARELAGPAGEVRKRTPLWLAGGLGPDNIGETIRELSPELVDASSGLEETPGCKDRAKLENYFREIDTHAHV
jgi:indole-3-glycerol phosphate synthase/phosphoribosylanthranilate isomerase